MIKNCYIRVDANNTIGTGHLVRTEILADKLSEKGINITFLCKDIPVNYKSHITSKNFHIELIKESKFELYQINKILNKTENNILIVDSDKNEFYTKEFQLGIKNNGIKLMIITFFHQYHFYADIILNQNIMALSQTYFCEDYTIKLLGPKNVILNNKYREISKNLNHYKNKNTDKTVLISFGGVDKPNRTELILKSLLNIENKPGKIIVILGSMYQHKDKIEQICQETNINTEVYQNTPRMPYLLSESDIVFSSGGLTVWEAGILKSLSIIIGFSEREKIGGKYLDENKFGFYLSDFEKIDLNNLTNIINKLINEDHSKIIDNLYSNIDVNGIYKVIDNIIKL